ncbi:hypothetical protein [Granulicella rosea]|uniref:hypothetical protein n=1 Tax=Granulicella rosea TaxID=474952 RepID=UPI000B77203E|nr:hypothetical protein [Granulicella rosea]
MTDAIVIHRPEEIAQHMDQVREAARRAHDWISLQSTDPIEFLKNVKFEKKGYHPVTHEPLNLIEQVNQTWTYLVALHATELLFKEHPSAGGFRLAPGANASQELDIMSVVPGMVGAETFAATSPGSNGKLKRDLEKMAGRSELHRYVFFACPQERYRETQKQLNHCSSGVEVWSIAI